MKLSNPLKKASQSGKAQQRFPAMAERSHLPTFPPGTLCSREGANPRATKALSVPGQIVPDRCPGRCKPSVYAGFPVPGHSSLKREVCIGNAPLIDRANPTTTPRRPASHTLWAAPAMEHTVNKHDTTPALKNLHPIWHRHFGVQTLQPSAIAARPALARQPQARPAQPTSRDASQALLCAVQALVAARGPVKPVY